MIAIKTAKEIEIMAKGGKILGDTLSEVLHAAKPGVTELELDRLAEELIRKAGGEPGFMKVPGYHHAICISTNNVIVHGIPTTYKLQKGDVVGIDCGVFLDGFHTDMSETIVVGGSEAAGAEVTKFLEIGKNALNLAIEQAKPGNRIGHISKMIQVIVEQGAGYGITRELIGHGVGRELHEEPEVSGYLRGKIEKTPLLKEGMVIAIEVIYTMGKREIAHSSDGWTIVTKDGSLSGLFERTVAITPGGHKVLTPMK